MELHSRIRLIPPKLCDINYLILSEVLFSEIPGRDNNSYCAEQFFELEVMLTLHHTHIIKHKHYLVIGGH